VFWEWQGIVTAPILFALKEHPQMYDLIKRKFRKADDVNLALEMVKKSHGIAKTQELAAEHAQEAVDAIASLPPCEEPRVQQCRRALMDLAYRVTTRCK
jgi:geranyl diphosphate synthase